MATNFKADSKRSRESTNKFIKAVLEFCGVNVASTENHSTPLETMLDRSHGIDQIGIKNGKLYSFATRAITTDKERGKDYPFVSVRVDRQSGNETEFQKMKNGAYCAEWICSRLGKK